MIINPPLIDGINLGFISLKFYALGYLIGFFVVYRLFITDLLWARVSLVKEEALSIGLWIFLGGIMGARLYHILTSLNIYFTDYRPDLLAMLNIRNGGLGIPGGLFGGLLAGYLRIKLVKDREFSFVTIADLILPNILIAQSIGRVGNYFNQELYGRPLNTGLRLMVEPEFRPENLQNIPTYHPTFLYEALGCLFFFLLYRLYFKFKLIKAGSASGFYFLTYGIGRLIVESFRIDWAPEILGQRINSWVSVLLIVIGLLLLTKNFISKKLT